ncbi:Delta(1)-pyrroline-2-carboxylate reductase [Paenibacillus sp. JJ-100]|uniref:ornithine cyclodeaminase family protein n=1 Tax=Paenibacillus sp. JJ-100 TaxID=2974896 RepID=UPI0022FFACC4|nr:ornithine cyclodeaminase family protein [Paenibacillus sp. JJ-100]CAI6048110.1 Delta(1)-pyrroline-2-carboxylate reductase [Paenibacillus sp. JJ-100]
MRFLSNEHVRQGLHIPQVIDLVETVYRARSEHNTETWPTIFYDFVPGAADMDIKSGYVKSAKIFGHKTVTWFAENEAKQMPTLMGLINVFDAETGKPIGMTEASFITGIRTGASGAIGAKYLARKDSETLLIVGSGNQAIFQIASALCAFPSLKVVRVAARDLEKLRTFVDTIPTRLQAEFGVNTEEVTFQAADSLEQAVKASDIIITVTPSRTPILKREWVKQGTHISCMGADMEGKQEIDSSLVSEAKVFVDDKEHCMQAGEIEIPLKEGKVLESHICGEIGDLIAGNIEGRTSDEQITIFDATGMAILDIYAANIALQMAEEKGFGVKIEM